MTPEFWLGLAVLVVGLVGSSSAIYARLAVMGKQIQDLETAVNRFCEFWDSRKCDLHGAEIKRHSKTLENHGRRITALEHDTRKRFRQPPEP